MTIVAEQRTRSVKHLTEQGMSADNIARHVGVSARTVQRIRTRPDPFPEPITMPGEWASDALCAQTDPEIFFPEIGANNHQAKAVCAGCPVRSECLEYALTNREMYGVFGGLSVAERVKLIRGSS